MMNSLTPSRHHPLKLHDVFLQAIFSQHPEADPVKGNCVVQYDHMLSRMKSASTHADTTRVGGRTPTYQMFQAITYMCSATINLCSLHVKGKFQQKLAVSWPAGTDHQPSE
jgi:hypothetical protein